MADGVRMDGFKGQLQSQWPYKVHVEGQGLLGPGQVMHAVPDGRTLSLQMKAAIAAEKGPSKQSYARPFELGRLSGLPFSTQDR